MPADVDHDHGLAERTGQEQSEGLARGRADDQLSAEAMVLLGVGERRFGPLPDSARVRIAAADLDGVERCLDRLLEAASLDDLLSDLPAT